MAETEIPARATNLDELDTVFSRMFDEQDTARALEVKLRPTDVVITPYAKCGTTWLQQIVHCLRTRGDMDFDDISRVVPWIETAVALGIDLDAEQKANPRAFKSHLDWHRVPRGARYIDATRNPGDALYSNYKFLEGWLIEPGSISSDEFAREYFMATGRYWKHLLSWWEVRERPDVMLIAFEHMKQDLTGTIRKVAEFIGIELDDDLLALTEEHASFAFMERHKDRFDDLMMRDLGERVANLSTGSDSAKIRKGTVGEHKRTQSPEVIAELDAIWQREITPVTGHSDYAALIADLD
jgi:hypothetical protein